MPPTELRCGVFGAGALGRHHVRLLGSLPGARRIGLYDPRPEAAEAMAAEHGATVFPSFEALAAEIDAAVVATPTVTHRDLACELLARGVHVLVEKPIAATTAEADAMIAAAAAAGRVLAVGHVEFHNPAVAALLAAGGAPRFVEIERLGVFSPRSLDIDVVADLMIHDLQILHALDDSALVEVRATGIPVLSERVDIVSARLEFASGLVANVTASRVSSERVRKLRAFYPDRYRSLDYHAQEIKGYRLDVSSGERRILPESLAVEAAEPLRRELDEFLAACRGEPSRSVAGAAARRALETAAAV
ncbi:MAG: Gfo/Idh/MocA family oxidoreductase, partial [Thermoanaerobaculia bacterium]|nr:Gfo/Idh/MocA family oxidoreductase [Thermoanaerobaculia bacterium]